MRYIITFIALLGVVLGLSSIKYLQIASLIAGAQAAQQAGPPPEAVGTSLVQLQEWDVTLNAVGTVAAAKGVTLANDAAGVVTAIHFDSGARVTKGQILVELDRHIEKAQLAAAQARKELAATNAGRSRVLSQSGVISVSQLDNDEASEKTSVADVGALSAQIDRKVLRAPFSGRLGIRKVNLGQYLNPGTPVAVLESDGAVFVDFTLPQQVLEQVEMGMKVRVAVAGVEGTSHDGAVTAIDPVVDGATRAVKLQATVDNRQGKLLSGMFAKVQLFLEEKASVTAVPATAVMRASYGDSVFVVEHQGPLGEGKATTVAMGAKVPKVARQQFVRTGRSQGDFVEITNGLEPGQEVVTSGAFKLRNGSVVGIDNSVAPKAALDPKLQDR